MKKITFSILGVLLALCLIMPISALEGSNASGDASGDAPLPPVVEPSVQETVNGLVDNGIITPEQAENVSNVTFEAVATEEKNEVTPENVAQAAGNKTVSSVVVSANVKTTIEYNDDKANLELAPQGGEFNSVKVMVDLSEEAVKELTADIPAGYNREYYVVRVHEGTTELLPAKLVDGKLVFSSEKFSDFYVVYNDVKKVEPKPEPKPQCAGSEDKNCDGIVTCEEAKGKGWEWNEDKKACVFTGSYHVVNTATK